MPPLATKSDCRAVGHHLGAIAAVKVILLSKTTLFFIKKCVWN